MRCVHHRELHPDLLKTFSDLGIQMLIVILHSLTFEQELLHKFRRIWLNFLGWCDYELALVIAFELTAGELDRDEANLLVNVLFVLVGAVKNDSDHSCGHI